MSVPMSQPEAKVMSSPCVAAQVQIATAIMMGPRFNDSILPRGLDQSMATPAHFLLPAYVNPSIPRVHIRLGVSRCDDVGGVVSDWAEVVGIVVA